MTEHELLVGCVKWGLLFYAAGFAFMRFLKLSGKAGASRLHPLADALFGPSLWREQGLSYAFGTPLFRVVRGTVEGQEAWLQFSSGDQSDTLLVFLPVEIASLAIVAVDGWASNLFPGSLSVVVEPRIHGLGDKLAVRTERDTALFGNEKIRSLRGLCGEPWFSSLRLAPAAANKGPLKEGTIDDGCSGITLRLSFPPGRFESLRPSIVGRLRELVAAALSLRTAPK